MAETFSADERAAMKDRVAELAGGGKGDRAVRKKIDAFSGADQRIALGLHEIVRRVAPELEPKLWYGMPAYARGKEIVVFFQGTKKFKSRYSTIGFNDIAKLDDGILWPTSYAVAGWDDATAERIEALVARAIG